MRSVGGDFQIWRGENISFVVRYLIKDFFFFFFLPLRFFFNIGYIINLLFKFKVGQTLSNFDMRPCTSTVG